MTKQNIVNVWSVSKAVARKSVQVAKVAIIGAVVITSLVGGYVLTNAELRNHTIDFAQNQVPAQAEGPKAN